VVLLICDGVVSMGPETFGDLAPPFA
jgi:hypothetical protein